MNIKGTKRTQRIDDERLVKIAGGAVVEAGGAHGLALTEEQKREVAHKLEVEGPFRKAVQELVEDILTLQAAFIESVFESAKDSSRLNVIFDGARVVVRMGDRPVAKLDPLKNVIDAELTQGVLTTLDQIRKEALAQSKAAGVVTL